MRILSPELNTEKLIESLDMPDNPLSAGWQEEIRRRCAEFDNSTGLLRDADSVFKNAYASLT
ncbi:addiction module protein [Thiovibrio frasassiensis]|uniref:addiction module protein n=1 Tax=Thiovibrio frasassiensis TaxID=2984131 RepID=UPI003530E2A2